MQGMSDILEDEIKLSNSNATVNVTVTGLACDRSGNSCSAVGVDGFSAQLELYCGNAKYPSSSFLVSGEKWSLSFLEIDRMALAWGETVLSSMFCHLVADYVGATQTIIYTPLSSIPVNETEDIVIRCIVTAPYFNSGPVSYQLSAEEVDTLPTLSEEEQASLTATYEQYVNSQSFSGYIEYIERYI